MGSGWGSVGRLVTSNSKIELRQRETHLLLTIEKTKIKKKAFKNRTLHEFRIT